jgi:hypothetical protein
MDDPADLAALNAELAALLRERLGVRGETFEARLNRAGRLLPRAVRAAGRELVAKERMWENPKLRRQIDRASVAAAAKVLRSHLDSIDAADRRRGYWIGVLTPLAFNLLLLLGGVTAWLVWSGRV